jgi:hypothetical protein
LPVVREDHAGVTGSPTPAGFAGRSPPGADILETADENTAYTDLHVSSADAALQALRRGLTEMDASPPQHGSQHAHVGALVARTGVSATRNRRDGQRKATDLTTV